MKSGQLKPILKMALLLSIGLSLAACAQMNLKLPAASAPADSATQANPEAYGQDKFRAGPIYNGSDYLGDDPDPFIREQIKRDLGIRYPGMG